MSERAASSEFRVFNGRLAQFKPWSNDADAWEARWVKQSHAFLLAQSSSGYLDEFEIFTRYLPKNLPVLEAGCGLGQLVMALAVRGYSIEGVDYAKETIARIQALAPELKVRLGDVYALDAPDGSYGGYISMGVFEHHPAGPIAGLREARRVLHPDGIAFITVPYLNPQREKILCHLEASVPPESWGIAQVTSTQGNKISALEKSPDDLQFYQYYFSIAEFEQYLAQAQLKIKEVFPYAVYAGLTRDFPLGRLLEDKRFLHWRLKQGVHALCKKAPMWARRRWGHMLMFVCKPMPGRLHNENY